jgi:hypothetical protein
MIDQNVITYNQAAEIFGITVMGVYQKFHRLKKGKLKGKGIYLKPEEIERLKGFLKEFDDFIDSLIAIKNRFEGE